VARKMPAVQITLNRAGVAAPVQRAAIASSDVIAAGLTAFAADTLAKPTMPDQFPELQIRGPEMTSGPWRTMYQNWLLAVGFQSLVRGTRKSLEEAAMYLKLLSEPPKIPMSATWEDLLASVRNPASKLSSPDLLATVNAGLSSPLDFEREFLSMLPPGPPPPNLQASMQAAVSVHVHRASGEPPARQPGPLRYGTTAASVRSSGRRRTDGAGLTGSHSCKNSLRRLVAAVQLHGRHQRPIVYCRGARERRCEAGQPRNFALSRGYKRSRECSARSKGPRHLWLCREDNGHARAKQLHNRHFTPRTRRPPGTRRAAVVRGTEGSNLAPLRERPGISAGLAIAGESYPTPF